MLEWMCVWSSECDMLCKSALTARVEKWHVKTSPFTWGTVVSACECVDGHEIRVFDLILHWKTKLCLFIALKWDAVTSLVWMGVCAGVRQHSETQCCFSKAGISHLQLFLSQDVFFVPMWTYSRSMVDMFCCWFQLPNMLCWCRMFLTRHRQKLGYF